MRGNAAPGGGEPCRRRGEGVAIHHGFYTEGQRWTYVSGVIEGMLLAPLYGAPKSKMVWIESCIVGTLYSAMIGACKGSP